MKKQNRSMAVEAGGVRIEIQYRRRGKDSGPSFEVYGSDGERLEHVLRFDCFKLRPHFHLIGSKRSKIERIDGKTAPDPVKWTLSRLKRDLRSLIQKAGHWKLAEEINQSAVARALSRAEKKIVSLAGSRSRATN
jgi:hypothetical protein